MGQMRTINKADWKPTQLASPDGRRYTPGSFREDRELRSKGYVPAPVEPAAAAPEPTDPPKAGPSDPVESTPNDAAVVEDQAAPAVEDAGTDTTPKAKTTTRRSGGAQ